MSECPVCAKEIPEGDSVRITATGSCSICALDFTADTRSIEYEKTDAEKGRLAEVKRLQSIALGSHPKSTQMTKMKGLLALMIIVCILVYTYIWDKHNSETKQSSRIEVTYRAFNQLFGPSSSLSGDEKLEEFKYWRMAPVRWKGTISYVNIGPDDELYTTVSHPARIASSNVLIRFEDHWREQLEGLRVGQTLFYGGRISEYDRGTSFITLKQGAIIKVRD
jgi:preprotein translocase subunit SecG